MKESINSIKQLSNLKPLNIILYYSDTCGYCHMFKDHWSDIVRKIKTQRLNVKPVSIESRHFGDLGTIDFFNTVQGVPTLSLVDKDGGFVKKFEGERNPENVINWLKEHTPKSTKHKSRKHRKKKSKKKIKQNKRTKKKHKNKHNKTKRFVILE